ncbi:hypothetical protein JYU34_002179 [Plutella xylostella]|uniref:Uncharacterized protein n=1 Tax=Plutella xylostella TaxID=51655 RepID=A0ABQ7R1L9_PLUXY|nr:hypothetical protein JYU34_002179 [Plutella xylostella]
MTKTRTTQSRARAPRCWRRSPTRATSRPRRPNPGREPRTTWRRNVRRGARPCGGTPSRTRTPCAPRARGCTLCRTPGLVPARLAPAQPPSPAATTRRWASCPGRAPRCKTSSSSRLVAAPATRINNGKTR